MYQWAWSVDEREMVSMTLCDMYMTVKIDIKIKRDNCLYVTKNTMENNCLWAWLEAGA